MKKLKRKLFIVAGLLCLAGSFIIAFGIAYESRLPQDELVFTIFPEVFGYIFLPSLVLFWVASVLWFVEWVEGGKS